MPQKLPNRNVTPLLNAFRTILRGKPLQNNPLRFADKIAARTQPQPDLPGGPYARTTDMYYYTRDARREVQPPIVINVAKQLASGEGLPAIKAVTPGKVYIPK